MARDTSPSAIRDSLAGFEALPIWSRRMRPYTGGARDVTLRPFGLLDMIWIALLLIAFLSIGLRRPTRRRPQLLVLVVTVVTVAAMYLTFGG